MPAVGDAGEAPVVEIPAETPPEPAPAEVPEWLQGLAPAEAVVPADAGTTVVAEEPAPAAPVAGDAAPAEEVAAPDWLEGEGMPSGEEALAWLEKIAAGKEEELQAQVGAEIEARTAEIMGRPKAQPPEVAPQEPAAAIEEPTATEEQLAELHISLEEE